MRWCHGFVAGFAILLLVACGEAEVAQAPPVADYESPLAFVNAQEGKVVVLVLGMDGCAATRDATKTLVSMSGDFPDDVVAARIEVPGPGQAAPADDGRTLPIHRQTDPDRDLAEHLDFFYYPTVYVLDREGETRFAGGMDEAELGGIVAAVRAEEPGAEKRYWTAPLVPVGEAAPAIAGQELERDGPTLVFFGSIDCPYSRKALDGLVDVEVAFGAHDILYVIVEGSTRAKAVDEHYADRELSGDLVRDGEGKLGASYGVEAVPFFYVVDDTGTVAARGPYTPAAASKALAGVLGVKVPDGTADEKCGAG